jgi:hypothetical protein
MLSDTLEMIYNVIPLSYCFYCGDSSFCLPVVAVPILLVVIFNIIALAYYTLYHKPQPEEKKIDDINEYDIEAGDNVKADDIQAHLDNAFDWSTSTHRQRSSSDDIQPIEYLKGSNSRRIALERGLVPEFDESDNEFDKDFFEV